MTDYNDGGPAFPQTRVWNASLAEYEDTQQFPGMSLRDYFAGQALPNIAASYNGQAFDPSGFARIAYEYADAMLAARSAK